MGRIYCWVFSDRPPYRLNGHIEMCRALHSGPHFGKGGPDPRDLVGRVSYELVFAWFRIFGQRGDILEAKEPRGVDYEDTISIRGWQ
eukprot:scaffold184070_cov69-Attheya_sp.AAC.1